MVLSIDMFMVIAAPFVGSFLATLVFRLPAGAPIAFARSACPACGKMLSAISLVPIVSWLAQKGRCAHCQERISPTYPLVEVTALFIAIWAIWATTMAEGWLLAASCLLGWTLLTLSVIDSRHLILPDVLTLPLGVLGLIVTFAIDQGQFILHLAAALVGFATLAIVNELYRRVRGRDGLGLGDAKLLAAGGAWIGLNGLAGIVLIASFTALVCALSQTVFRQGITSQTRIAFGPFLSFGIWIIWLYGPLEFG
jgi:leader peptidase (prepilin peptidase)/N-methyltransferase